jgi:hypothetical protein
MESAKTRAGFSFREAKEISGTSVLVIIQGETQQGLSGSDSSWPLCEAFFLPREGAEPLVE